MFPAKSKQEKERLVANPGQYGDKYWGIKVTKDVSPDGEIYLNANEVRVAPDGSLLMIGNGGYPVLTLAAKKWTAVFAASCIDGHAVAVEHWTGEVRYEWHPEPKGPAPKLMDSRRCFTPEQKEAILRRSKGFCAHCAQALGKTWHADHIQPWSLGGKTEVENGQALCAKCNGRKGTRLLTVDGG